MGVVEGVLHHAQRAAVPAIIELVNAAVVAVAVLRKLGNRQQRFVKGNPCIAIALRAAERRHAGVREWLVGRKLRNPNQATGPLVFPTMIAADDVTVPAPALGKPCGAVAAAIPQRRRRAIAVEEEHEVLAHEREGLRAILEPADWERGVPEAPQNLLFRAQHLESTLIRDALDDCRGVVS